MLKEWEVVLVSYLVFKHLDFLSVETFVSINQNITFGLQCRLCVFMIADLFHGIWREKSMRKGMNHILKQNIRQKVLEKGFYLNELIQMEIKMGANWIKSLGVCLV